MSMNQRNLYSRPKGHHGEGIIMVGMADIMEEDIIMVDMVITEDMDLTTLVHHFLAVY
ncbi:hypothetical protein ACI2OX_11385 [Bacillus sp. N9]